MLTSTIKLQIYKNLVLVMTIKLAIHATAFAWFDRSSRKLFLYEFELKKLNDKTTR